MYGYLTLEGLLDDQLTVDVGRVLVDDGWGTAAIDGARGRYDLPVPLEVSASAGLRVRASSPLGVSRTSSMERRAPAARRTSRGRRPAPGRGS